MKYLYEQEALTATFLEAALGLAPGNVKEIVVYSTGAVEIETAFALTTTQQDTVKAALAKRNLPRGKKPKN